MYRKLWEPIRIGRMELKNRLVMPPMVTCYASGDGSVTPRSIAYYSARAKGGVGLVIVEATYIHRQGWAFNGQIGLSDDKFIPGMSSLVDAVHENGAKIAVQLHHGGREAKEAANAGMQIVSSSTLPGAAGVVPKELTGEEIVQIEGYFADAALRAKKAGFDGVELHGAHGYLIDQFLSPTCNKRNDDYGGDVRRRARFLLETIKAVRDRVGMDYPVWMRFDGKEYGPGGITLEDAQETAWLAQQAGLVALHVSAWGPDNPINMTSAKFTTSVVEELPTGIKKAVSIPVIAVGRITAEDGERMLAEGKADLIAIGKGLLADPDLPAKVAAGNQEDIKPCIVCMSCRDDLRRPVAGIRCSVNAALGKEKESQIVPASKAKKVLVVGGGPAGMEAARVAALKGHQVTLWEKEPELGGQLIQAAIPPYKDRIAPLTEYFKTQLRKLKVNVQVNKEATAAAIARAGPEVCIIATGVRALLPDIPGLNKDTVVQAGEVLEGKVAVGDRVAIIGGELVGCETAEFLADKGKKVTVMRRGPEMALGVGPSLRPYLLSRLKEKGVKLLTRVTYREVTPQGVVISTPGGKKETVPADTVVLAAGSLPQDTLCKEIKNKGVEVHCIGDCVEPRTIRDAVAEGFRVGSQV